MERHALRVLRSLHCDVAAIEATHSNTGLHEIGNSLTEIMFDAHILHPQMFIRP
jgi:hypothetical protein